MQWGETGDEGRRYSLEARVLRVKGSGERQLGIGFSKRASRMEADRTNF